MRNLCVETVLAFFTASIMFCSSAVFSGCNTFLPEPATSDGLSKAESKLDGLTDKRISLISVSASSAQELLGTYPDSHNKTIIGNELSIILAMTGEPNESELRIAEDRWTKTDDELNLLYENALVNAQNLKKQIDEANLNYEVEKAKKEAEYKSALKQKQIEIDQKKMELEQERLDKQAERWNMAGGFLLLVGIALALATPMKRIGLALIPCGLFIASVPFVMNEVWFKYSIIIIFVTGVVLGCLYIFKSVKKDGNTPTN